MIIGLIINPIAGMGGRVGLKGTDGVDILNEAIKRGATPLAEKRAYEALQRVKGLDVNWVTWEDSMGEDVLKKLGFSCKVLGKIRNNRSSAEDTRSAVAKMEEIGADLIIFAGGDGTAVDILEVVDMRVPVLGIPSGVKMYSAIFTRSPRAAGNLIQKFIKEEVPLREREVMDIDEEAYRAGRLSATLKGYLKTPFLATYVLSEKSIGNSADIESMKEAIAARVVEEMDPGKLYILGPGSTVGAVAEKLGVKKTLLGVDVVKNKKTIILDANEDDLMNVVDANTEIIISPLGGQGSLLGHGNQQISPNVLRKIGLDRLKVISTTFKLQEIKALTVDTSDSELDEKLRGYIRVIVGYHEEKVMHII